MSRGGRGRGRGRGRPREELGLRPGEQAPPPILQPPPLYPTLDRKPLELRSSEVEEYLVAIKQDMQQYMMKSPFHLVESASKSAVIARYSDKYRKNGETSSGVGWDIHWECFPKELGIDGKQRRKQTRTKHLPMKSDTGGGVEKNVVNGDASSDHDGQPKPKKRRVTFDNSDSGGAALVKKLETLERAEQLSAESEQSAEEENAEETYDEYEDEEGTDYNLTYFDNGEDYDVGGDDNALEEGPVY